MALSGRIQATSKIETDKIKEKNEKYVNLLK